MSVSAQSEPTPRFGWAEVRGLNFYDLVALVWAERAWVLGVGAAICALGLCVALLAPRTYTARAELLVRLGEEYVYQPTLGGAAAGATPDMPSVVNAEMRLIGSGAVVRAAITEIGLARLYPEIAAGSGSEARKMAAAERAFAEHLALETAPQTPAVALSFEHRNAELASQALNALVDQYLERRRDLLVGGEYQALTEQSAEMNTRLSAASVALSQFLTEHEIADFDAEMAALAARAADAETQLYDALTRQREAEARVAALRAQMQAEPAEIALYTESDARRDLVAAQMERQELLSRYQDDAPPVREVDRRIAQLEGFLAGGDPPSVTRRGPNPVRQAIATQLYETEAEARAQRGRGAALTQQREDVRTRLQDMRALEPQFRQLAREKAILEANAQSFAQRAEQARGYSELLGRSTDSISQVERASPPAQGKSLRMPIAVVTLLLAGLAALSVGLLRGLMKRSFPTPQAAARALGAPVLAVAPRKPVKARSAAKPDLKLVKGGA
ncbi:MAG: Wzz/FepE/Etk N-terminal domain-containing protein [Hyphomonadaceae bacterium]|nr:Wzz/FepE/Etk N-terminal domain-containing protein [Hyphomonadaceae bacterium]